MGGPPHPPSAKATCVFFLYQQSYCAPHPPLNSPSVRASVPAWPRRETPAQFSHTTASAPFPASLRKERKSPFRVFIIITVLVKSKCFQSNLPDALSRQNWHLPHSLLHRRLCPRKLRTSSFVNTKALFFHAGFWVLMGERVGSGIPNICCSWDLFIITLPVPPEALPSSHGTQTPERLRAQQL